MLTTNPFLARYLVTPNVSVPHGTVPIQHDPFDFVGKPSARPFLARHTRYALARHYLPQTRTARMV